jgi:putative flippase GtrA
VSPTEQALGLRDRLTALLHDRRIRYVVTGGIAAVVYYAFFTIGWVVTGGQVPYLVMAVVANLLCAVSTYPLYARVFHATSLSVVGFLRFYVLCLLSLSWSLVGLPLLVELGHVPVLLAVPIVIAAAPLLNYQLMKFWTFRHRNTP